MTEKTMKGYVIRCLAGLAQLCQKTPMVLPTLGQLSVVVVVSNLTVRDVFCVGYFKPQLTVRVEVLSRAVQLSITDRPF